MTGIRRGRFIVIEGPDGSGKSTQIELLRRYLKLCGMRNKFIHFPRYSKRPYGEVISRYLRGEFGGADTVDPYLASLPYAGDRKEADREIRKWTEAGLLVIADRHYLSNLAYQGAKIGSKSEKAAFAKWLYELEFRFNKILKPDLCLFLDAPTSFIMSGLKNERKGTERAYLNNHSDIHEVDEGFQKRVVNEYLAIARSQPDICIIKCYDNKDNMLEPELIHTAITDKLRKKRIL